MPDSLIGLVARQRLVDATLRNEGMPRRAVVETLVRRQHQAELDAALARVDPDELCRTLDTLELDDARRVWARLPERRRLDAARGLSAARLDALAPSGPEAVDPARIRAYRLDGSRLVPVPLAALEPPRRPGPMWVDMLDATAAERSRVSALLDVELEGPVPDAELQVSARFSVDPRGTLRLHSNFLDDASGGCRNVPVAFHLRDDLLVSVRDDPVPAFDALARSFAGPPEGASPVDLLLGLYAADVEQSADSLERAYSTLEAVGRRVLAADLTDHEASRTLAGIAEEEARNGRIRGNVRDTQRAIGFLTRHRVLSPAGAEDAKRMLQNVDALNAHTAYLFDKVNFLMDATIGFINVNQNRRVNQLTAFSVVAMPINILAGIGGMSEFSMMTEGIGWPIAYGAFVALAATVGWVTFAMLRRAERHPARRRPSRAA